MMIPRLVSASIGAVLVLNLHGFGQGRLLDSFEDPAAWTTIVPDGVTARISSVQGVAGKALGLHFSFQGGAGYAIAQRPLRFTLPAQYRFTFFLRGTTPVNNFEFKLLDSAGNVYWLKTLNRSYPQRWQRETIRQRQISFAWGPAAGGRPHTIDKIEFVVSAGTGGTGLIAVDELRLEEIDTSAASRGRPIVRWSSQSGPSTPVFAAGDSVVTGWRSAGRSKREWLLLDLGSSREIGGLVVEWDSIYYASAYDVECSDDTTTWIHGYSIRAGNGRRDLVPLKDTDCRYVRLSLRRGNRGAFYKIDRITVKDPSFGASLNAVYGVLASGAPPGLYPKYFNRTMSYWTVIGANGDGEEALMNEEGMVETGRQGFSLEPFLWADGRLVNRPLVSQSLERGDLPIPSVRWEAGDVLLVTRAFVSGDAGASVLCVTYTLKNTVRSARRVALYVAVRPFQVNPPSQWLNIEGGASQIRSLRYDGSLLHVDEQKVVIPLSQPAAFGATAFDRDDIAEYLLRGVLPDSTSVVDWSQLASGAFRYDINLPAGVPVEFSFAVPFHADRGGYHPNIGAEAAHTLVENRLRTTRQQWEKTLDAVQIHLPPGNEELIRTVRSTLGYILINRDGPAIQPGSRSYERSWIRDGSLTSSALLRFGRTEEVRQFVEWYSRYQYPNGKVPCVVDDRGADPVPENDSHGQLIFATMEYFRFARDTSWLAKQFPGVVRAVRYIQSLRAERKTEQYTNGTPVQKACYGLLPESISHEGYSSKPMHSYWDDFFALRGLKDAAAIAAILGERSLAEEFGRERDDLRADLVASLRSAMHIAGIDFLPGCVELGDFDATSTAIALSPGGELGNLPEPALQNTFDRYYRFFTERARGDVRWENYTPYELRLVGAFVMLGQRERAHSLLDFFMESRRPAAWNHWAEVVWSDPGRPAFVGDMPHTWVGSDFLRSIRTMFVYERERDTSLIVGAGLASKWVEEDPGVRAEKLPTYYGPLTVRIAGSKDTVHAEVSGLSEMPSGGIRLVSPYDRRVRRVSVNGRESSMEADEILLPALPARVEIIY